MKIALMLAVGSLIAAFTSLWAYEAMAGCCNKSAADLGACAAIIAPLPCEPDGNGDCLSGIARQPNGIKCDGASSGLDLCVDVEFPCGVLFRCEYNEASGECIREQGGILILVDMKEAGGASCS